MTGHNWPELRALVGWHALVVYRGDHGWWVLCPGCQVDRSTIGESFANWEVISHNATRAHMAGVDALRALADHD